MTTPADAATLLYVEDSESDVLFFRRAMDQVAAAVSVKVVSDGAQAIDYLSGKDPYSDRVAHPYPAVMLLDLKLPKKSGLDVLEWMKKQGLKSPKVIVLTASAESGDVQAAYRSGAFAYVVKPVSIGPLLLIAKALAVFCRDPDHADAGLLGWHVRPFL